MLSLRGHAPYVGAALVLFIGALSACSACESEPPGPGDGGPPPPNACVSVPTACTELLPEDSAAPAAGASAVLKLPQPVTGCFVARKSGRYVHDYINIIDGGALYFEEDPAGDIDFRARSILVEQGGLLQAGAEGCPFGAQGRRLSIGLYGDDPSKQSTIPAALLTESGIDCETNKDGGMQRCLPSWMQPDAKYYCTVGDSNDPCSSTTEPRPGDAINGASGKNFLLEHYHPLNFDGAPFGYKVLAVSYGGSVRLFGDKGTRGAAAVEGSGSCRVPTAAESTLDADELRSWAKLTGSSWTRLDAQTEMGDRSVLTLDRRIDDWREGDEIVLAPTDWYPGHHEVRSILTITQLPAEGKTQIEVKKLDYPHADKMFDTKDIEAQGGKFTDVPRRKAADLRAPVGLLSRSIQIRSLGKTAGEDFPTADQCMAGSNDPACYFGGHVLFRQGFRDVQIQGVEFKQLGQGGRMGHYPVHFHLAKSTKYTAGKTFVRDSSIWDSMTRFIVMHGSHDIDLSRNVGFLSVGHGFYGEDASEINNRLCHNLGIGARAAMVEYYDAQKQLYQAARMKDATLVAPPTVRAIPPILDGVNSGRTDDHVSDLRGGPAQQRMGSDGLMPVMFWMMNAYNELVGNQSSGVYGFGSCYWLIGSGLSGASQDHALDGLAVFNGRGGQQAPLLRFRGNGCSTASMALPASLEMPPAGPENIGYTQMRNPYLFHADGVTAKTMAELKDADGLFLYERPIVTGNFRPIQPGADQKNCSAATGVMSDGTALLDLERNVASCATTYLDRFTTSFNWTQVNFGSIWLRPWFYVFANGAVTDQLFGGLTFVTAGSWLQVPPAHFSLAQDNLFVGTTQYAGSPVGNSIYAKKSGPIMRVRPDTALQPEYEPCAGGKDTCNFPEEGVGFWSGSLQPKRLINIYDGPTHADGNTFLNVGAWECDPQPCARASDADCRAKLPLVPDGSGDREFACGIYGSTQQPSPLPASQTSFDPATDFHRMVVVDAAIGWKQPNGFYYPPAFGHARASFLSQAPTLPGQTGLTNGLNQCFVPGGDPAIVPGDCRHNAMDRTQIYIRGVLNSPTGDPILALPAYDPAHPLLQTTPIDFQTVLIDTDGSLTGATGTLGSMTNMPTTSVSRNRFFDAPAQDRECLSYGVQTSPYQFATTAVAKLGGPAVPGPGPTKIINPAGTIWALTPMVPIYRQWISESDRAAGDPPCGEVCSEADPKQYGCPRASFMMGATIGQASHLTMSVPKDSVQPGALYYIDTNAQNQSVECVAARPGPANTAPFTANDDFVVYNLFARPDTRTSYSVYVGDSATDLASISGAFVRVDPHKHALAGSSELNSQVTLDCDPSSGSGWCTTASYASITNGVLTVTLDHSVIADDFLIASRESHDRCMPRDLCYFDGTRCASCANNPSLCTRSLFTADDVGPLSHAVAGSTNPLDTVCDWSTRSSGTVTNTGSDRVFVDCPRGGCLGFSFKLRPDFSPRPYKKVNPPSAAVEPPTCFTAATWSLNSLLSTLIGGVLKDPLCGAARQSQPADYCVAP